MTDCKSKIVKDAMIDSKPKSRIDQLDAWDVVSGKSRCNFRLSAPPINHYKPAESEPHPTSEKIGALPLQGSVDWYAMEPTPHPPHGEPHSRRAAVKVLCISGLLPALARRVPR